MWLTRRRPKAALLVVVSCLLLAACLLQTINNSEEKLVYESVIGNAESVGLVIPPPRSPSADAASPLRAALDLHANDINASDDLVRQPIPTFTNRTADLELMFEKRKNKIQETCSINNLNRTNNLQVIRSEEFLINYQYKLVWCNIFKSASTTWLHHFLSLAGYTDEDVKRSKKKHLQFARTKAYPRPSLEQLEDVLHQEDYTSFVVVRDPLERLLSSYRDKISKRVDHFYDKLRCKIIKKAMGRTCMPTFPQFVDFVIEQANAGKKLDEHWQTYDTFCSPCLVNYTYTLHFENLNEEERFFLNQIPDLPPSFELDQLNNSGSNYSVLLPQFYSQLSEDQVLQLFRIYEKDFQLFGYSRSKYLDFVKGQKT